MSLRSRIQLQSFNIRRGELNGFEVRLRQHHALLQKHVFEGNNVSNEDIVLNNECNTCFNRGCYVVETYFPLDQWFSTFVRWRLTTQNETQNETQYW